MKVPFLKAAYRDQVIFANETVTLLSHIVGPQWDIPILHGMCIITVKSREVTLFILFFVRRVHNVREDDEHGFPW